MLDKPCSLCTPPAQADGSPGGVPMAGARTRPCAGRAALSRPMRATCSPWGQRAGRGPRTRGGAAPQRPWSDFYRQGGKRCWEGRRRVTVRGAGGPRSPAVTSGCADKPQPRLLAATTTVVCMSKAPGEKDDLELSPQDWGSRPPSLLLATCAHQQALRCPQGLRARSPEEGDSPQAAGSSPHPDRPRLTTPPRGRAPRGHPARQGVISCQVTAQSART